MKENMNLLLSDLVAFYHKLQSYHWYVKGQAFYQVHGMLEAYYDEVNAQIDEIAEAALMSGIKPVSRLSDFSSLTKIEEPANEYISVEAVFESVLKDFSYLLKSVEEIKAAADEENNYLISAKMDGLIEAYKKHIWMISQTRM